MRKTLITFAGLGLALSLAACSDSGSGSETATEAATTATAEEGGACAGFFEGAVPLADRATADREALTGGQVTDSATYAEINALESRIDDLARTAPEDVAALLEEVNAPFTEAVERVNAAEPDAEGNVTFPDLTDIDVSGSQAAQEELASACEQ